MLEKDLPIISSERLTRVSYEEFIERPRQELARLYDFAGLSWYDGLEKYVPEKLILENNSKWEALAERDREILETAFPSATNSTA